MTGIDNDDPVTDAIVDAVARKALPLAQAAIQLRLARGGIDQPDLVTRMQQLQTAAQQRTARPEVLPPPDPATRLDVLAGHEAAAAAIDRGVPDDPSTVGVDENAHGLDDAGRHQAYADRLATVAVARSHATPLRPARGRTTVAVGPSPSRTTATRTRAPSRRVR